MNIEITDISTRNSSLKDLVVLSQIISNEIEKRQNVEKRMIKEIQDNTIFKIKQ